MLLRPRPSMLRQLGAAFAILGPGLITGAAGDDAGGVATYASVGAQYGYTLLWALGLVTIALVIVQLQIARLGIVTGKGLAELIREEFGVRWSAFAMLVLLIANGTVTIAEFAGIAASAELFNVPRVVAVPVAALLAWWIVVGGSYRIAERIFLVMSAALLTYVGAAFLAGPDWGEVARSAVVPTFTLERGYINTLITLVGTTLTPYMLFYLQASLSDKGTRIEEYPNERIDVVVGAVASGLIGAFIIICTAATLFIAGIQVDTAEAAARALEPLAGPYARVLFGAGLFAASMLAASVLPLSTSYAICGAFGWERTISRPWREAPLFNSLYTALIVLAAAFVLIPGLPLIAVIVATQTLNGVLLPIILVFVTRLAGDRSLLGKYANGPYYKLLAWAVAGLLTVLTVLLIGFSLLGFS
jgi:NRAMP (natural resistance-associated macrophage protein)-like metal ion transporter